jgi:hypothetical protein
MAPQLGTSVPTDERRVIRTMGSARTVLPGERVDSGMRAKLSYWTERWSAAWSGGLELEPKLYSSKRAASPRFAKCRCSAVTKSPCPG